VTLAEALSVVGRKSDFEIVRSALTTETLATNPLLGAAEQLDKGRTEASRQLLAKVEPDKLDVWRLTLWARLMRETGRDAEAESTLQTLGVETDTVAGAQAGARAAVPATSLRRVAAATPVAGKGLNDPAPRVLRRKKRAKKLQVRTASRPNAAAQSAEKQNAAKSGVPSPLPWPFGK
jgi:hypothetical protein